MIDKIDISPVHQRTLHNQHIGENEPGAVLRDFASLLDFVGAREIVVSGKNQLLPMSRKEGNSNRRFRILPPPVRNAHQEARHVNSRVGPPDAIRDCDFTHPFATNGSNSFPQVQRKSKFLIFQILNEGKNVIIRLPKVQSGSNSLPKVHLCT